ncbi:MAG: SRPBCC family protein [Candidatus Caldarchaeum sp.]
MLWKFDFVYEVPASPGEVYAFFRNVENMSKVWPAEMKMRLVAVEGDVYTVRFQFLGQTYTTKFRIEDKPGMKQFHETLNFPFGKLQHSIEIEPTGLGSKVTEKMELRSNNPLAGYFFKKILDYRHEAIKHSFGVVAKPVYRDPFELSTAAGNLISIVGVAAAYLLLILQPFQFTGGRFITGIISFALLWFFTHDLAHYVVGRIAGIRFSNYYIGLSNIVRLNIIPQPLKTLPVALGIKIDRENSKATPRGYAAMYAAGPVASMAFPLTVPIIFLANNVNSIAGLLLLIFAIANIIFTSIFSPKAGCFAKARKALKKTTTQI